jgi:putative addiction module component (TIGR02574 family)
MTSTTSFETLLEAALALPPEQRHALVEAIQNSLATIEPAVEASHLAEVERRIRAHEAGESRAIPHDVLLRELRGG